MPEQAQGRRAAVTKGFVGLLLAALPAWAQTAVEPSGAGTLADPYLIAELGHLVWMGANAGTSSGTYYALAGDIDAGATAGWNDEDTDEGILEGFRPIGMSPLEFRGSLDGRGHVIRGLVINRTQPYGIGLFGWIGHQGVVQRLGLEGGSISGRTLVGSLAGSSSGTVTQCYAAGAVRGRDGVGGLLGQNIGTLTQCYATGTVSAEAANAGGLVGWNEATIERCYANVAVGGASDAGGLLGGSFGTVTQCYATGTVSGGDGVGGLLGMGYATVTRCYATGAVTGHSRVGGLMGRSAESEVAQCHATGPVAGEDSVGGLLGAHTDGTVTQCYATGATAGTTTAGGLVGYSENADILQCYARGAVTGGATAGGLVGLSLGGTVTQCYAAGTVTSATGGGLLASSSGSAVAACYWDTETSGWLTSAGGTGRSSAQMRLQSTYAGWDFASVWGLATGLNGGYPHLLPAGPWPLRFVAVLGTADGGAGQGLWGLTGHYVTNVGAHRLALDLVHDAKGKLSGAAVYTVAKDVSVTMPIKGSVKGVGDSIAVAGTLQGASADKTVSVSLALDLTVDAANRQLRGPLTGTVKSGGVTTAISQGLALDVPAPMDGTWALAFQLERSGTAVAGTALLTLSNGVDHAFTVKGKTGADGAALLSLAGDKADPAAKAIKIKTAVIPLEGGWATIRSLSGKGYGQALGW